MKPIFLLLITLLSGSIMAPPACRAEAEPTSQYPPQLLKFSAAKERQVRNLASDLNIKLPPEVAEYFKAAARGDCAALTNTFARLGPEYIASYGKPVADVPAWVPLWQPMMEVEEAYVAFAAGGTKYPLAFGTSVIESIPAGSIYFGGNNAGLSLVMPLCESDMEGKPFYTLSQNALFSDRHMDYLRAMYGKQIHLPATNEVQKAFDEYKADALLRLKHDQESPNGPSQLKPGEDIRLVNGEVQVSGHVSKMEVNARLVKLILERNPKPDFYFVESFPLELIRPYLSPHGLIFKLNHEPVKSLTPAMLETDHAFWTKECDSKLGDWLKPDTSVSNVCQFVEAVYGRKDWSGYKCDPAYVTNEVAMIAFSKMRVSIAGLYHWRLTNKMADDPRRLRAEAAYAFRQAFALRPTDKVVVYGYLNFLMAQGEIEDAIMLLNTAHKLDPNDQLLEDTLTKVRDHPEQIKTSK